MPDLIIKPTNTSGNKVIIQDQAGGAVLTTADSGATLGNSTQDNITRLGTVTAGNLSHADIVYPAMAKVGTFTRNCNVSTATTVEVTGVGFQPSVVHFASSIQDGPSFSFGMSDGSTNLVFMTQYTTQNAGTPGANTANMCIYVHHAATKGTRASAAINSDGFTLTYVDIGSPDAVAVVTMWTAFR